MKLKAFFITALSAASFCGTAVADDDDDDGEHRDWDRDHGKQTLVVTKGTVLWNATVVDTRDGSLSRHRVIVVDEGRIRTIAPVGSVHVRVRGDAQLVNASGKYVVPGYLDMHVHAMAAADLPQPYWPLFLANGVTGIREMVGSPLLIQRARALNADSAAGLVDAPEVVGIPGAPLIGVPTAEAAVALVQQQKAQGATFIKMIAASRPAVLATLQEARNQGLPVAGHLVTSVPAVELSAAGWRSIEHLGAGFGTLLDCAADEANIRGDILKGLGAPPSTAPSAVISPYVTRALDAPLYRRVIDTYSASKCHAVAQALAANGTWQSLTLIRRRTMLTSDDQLFRADPNLKYVDPAVRALWEQFAQQYVANVPATAAATFREYYGLERNAARLMNRNGVPVLAGSDLGGIWVIAGFGLHQEFRELADAGFSPLEILQATTLNAARFLGREADLGSVDEGKKADLVLLERNPMRDSRNLDTVWAVLLKGKYFSKQALKTMKNEVAEAYAARASAGVRTAPRASSAGARGG